MPPGLAWKPTTARRLAIKIEAERSQCTPAELLDKFADSLIARLKQKAPALADCAHPVGQRISQTCMVCGKSVAGKR